LILGLLANGMSIAEVLAEHPGIDPADVRACIAYGAPLAGARFVARSDGGMSFRVRGTLGPRTLFLTRCPQPAMGKIPAPGLRRTMESSAEARAGTPIRPAEDGQPEEDAAAPPSEHARYAQPAALALGDVCPSLPIGSGMGSRVARTGA
jgi:hypothetical protein